MSKRQMIMILGVWVMILFVLGLPGSMKEILAIVTGVLIVGIASHMKSEEPVKPASSMPYVENKREPVAPVPEAPEVMIPKNDPQDPISL